MATALIFRELQKYGKVRHAVFIASPPVLLETCQSSVIEHLHAPGHTFHSAFLCLELVIVKICKRWVGRMKGMDGTGRENRGLVCITTGAGETQETDSCWCQNRPGIKKRIFFFNTSFICVCLIRSSSDPTVWGSPLLKCTVGGPALL